VRGRQLLLSATAVRKIGGIEGYVSLLAFLGSIIFPGHVPSRLGAKKTVHRVSGYQRISPDDVLRLLKDSEARECPTTGPKHSVGLVILLRVDQHWRSGIAPLVHECFTRNGS
jgi:hypothetical protein